MPISHLQFLEHKRLLNLKLLGFLDRVTNLITGVLYSAVIKSLSHGLKVGISKLPFLLGLLFHIVDLSSVLLLFLLVCKLVGLNSNFDLLGNVFDHVT